MDLKITETLDNNNLSEKNNLTQNLELNNKKISNNLEINNLKEELEIALNDRQNYFLNSELGQAINKGLDLGIKLILPEFLGEQVIDLKNNIIEGEAAFGMRDIVANAIIDANNSLGYTNKNYESISQTKKIVEEGKVLDKIYDFLDTNINNLNNNKEINKNTSKKITEQKNTINKSIENSVEESFDNQFKNFEKLEKYISNWKDYFNNQDFSGMQKEYYKMNTVMKELMPLEETINQYRYVENMQKLIKNNNKSFDLTEEQKELAEKLFSI